MRVMRRHDMTYYKTITKTKTSKENIQKSTIDHRHDPTKTNTSVTMFTFQTFREPEIIKIIRVALTSICNCFDVYLDLLNQMLANHFLATGSFKLPAKRPHLPITLN